MYVAASRRRHLPCVGVVRRFAEPINTETLAAYAAELGANPQGFGRRVVPARVPGARARWEPATVLPELRVEPEPLPDPLIAELLDEEVSMQPDPACDPGWRLTALTDSTGGTTVLTWLNHAYGDGRGILETAFVPGTPRAASTSVPASQTMRELGDVMVRFRRGVVGGARLGREAAIARRRGPEGELARLRPAVSALRTRDRSVGGRSSRRVTALARIDGARWDGSAAARGGSSNALLLAVLANLLRMARTSRGDAPERPLRLLLPFDTRLRGGAVAGSARATGNGADRTTTVTGATANAAGAAVLMLPGGMPGYGPLDGVRAATREALGRASAAAATAAAAPPGIIDAMALLPSAITHRLASRVQGNVDGVASNVGPIPAHVARLGRHTAEEVFLLAGPMLTDLTVCLGRDRGQIALGVVADPARLGPAGGLRERVAEELDGWGLDATVS
jgi:hypothetical protein